MSEFYDYIDAQLGDASDLHDINICVRRLWFYDFDGFPVRLWQGKGRLITEDDQAWLGTWNAQDEDLHDTPAIQDGRDGSSASYELGLTMWDLPGQSAGEMYNAIKAEQWRVNKRKVTCYLAAIKIGEGLRPSIPYVFFKELTMFAPRFSEGIEADLNGVLQRVYKVTVSAKDGNYGRANVPGGSYADTIQRQRALELGVTLDRGCEHVALLANKTFQLP